MAELTSPLYEEVDELRAKSVQLARSGDHLERVKVLLQAWDLLPQPKEQWDESYYLASYLIDSYLNVQNPAKANEWVEILVNCDPERDDDGERELFAGVVAYELGDFEKAKKNFAIADKESNGRNFKKVDSKYLKFYKQK